MAAAGVAAGGASAQASPVLAANLRLMDHARMAAGNGPVLHSMVAPSPPGVDATKPVSDAVLARRAGIAVDRLGKPVDTSRRPAPGIDSPGSVAPESPGSGNPSLDTSAAGVPAGTPHLGRFLTAHVAPSCSGTGTDGKRVQVVYAYEAGQRLRGQGGGDPQRGRHHRRRLRRVVGGDGGGRRVRWVADAECVPQVVIAQVPAGLIGRSANGAADWGTFKSALGALGLDRADRKYLVFGDAPAASPGICGLGDSNLDDSATGNANDWYAAQYGAVYQGCFAAFPDDQTSAGPWRATGTSRARPTSTPSPPCRRRRPAAHCPARRGRA